MEILIKIIEDRASEGERQWFIRDHPAALLTIDDADDVLAVPRGRALFERLVVEGPAVCVGVLAVIRNLACLEGSERLLEALARSTAAVCCGHEEFEALEQIRDRYRSQGQL
jgi:hypothetical protein